MDIFDEIEPSDLDQELLEQIKARQDFLRQKDQDTFGYAFCDQELLDYSLSGVKNFNIR